MGETAPAASKTHSLPAGDMDVLPRWGAGADWLDGSPALLDAAGGLVDLDETLRAWLGLGDVEIRGRPFWPLLLERCPTWAAEIARLQSGTEPLSQAKVQQPSEDGEAGACYRIEVARLPGGSVVRLSSILPAGEALAESGWGAPYRGEGAGRGMFVRLLRAETQLAKLARHWPGVIFSQRPDYSFQAVTGRIGELTGRSIQDWQLRPGRFWEVVHESDAAELQHQIQLAVQNRRTVTSTFRVRNLNSGRVSYVLEHREPVVSQSGLLLGYEGVWLDVTRQTLAERLLTSAAWKETLAVLTMGLAHDFSNVMAGIHSLSESFLGQVEAGHPFHEGLGLIKKSSLQASQLVHRIVNLHLGKPGERNYHDLNQVISELLELVRKVIPRRIEISTELSPDPLPAYVDAFEFRQVIINLALNAADAMPERGRLVFKTTRLREPFPCVRLHGASPRYPVVCLSVQDSGCGIKPSHLDLIFDPFFTTKSGGKGSGLGLYNARLFAEKHQGAIGVQSQEGKGSTFHVCLPETDFTESDARPVAASPDPQRRALILYGPPCALFDETAEILRLEGYHVAGAHSLERVSEFLGTGNYRYNGLLILTESTGIVLAPHIAGWRRINPALKLILRPIGRSRDDLEPALLKMVDLVVTADWSPRSLLDKLKATLKD